MPHLFLKYLGTSYRQMLFVQLTLLVIPAMDGSTPALIRVFGNVIF
jgi:hypothetical protein